MNRYLQLWGYDHARMTRAPAAARFEARTSNALWQFDIGPSDLKDIKPETEADANARLSNFVVKCKKAESMLRFARHTHRAEAAAIASPVPTDALRHRSPR